MHVALQRSLVETFSSPPEGIGAKRLGLIYSMSLFLAVMKRAVKPLITSDSWQVMMKITSQTLLSLYPGVQF